MDYVHRRPRDGADARAVERVTLGVLCKGCGEWFSVMPGWMKAPEKLGFRTCPWCQVPAEYLATDLRPEE